MSKFWQALLEKAIQKLLKSDWQTVIAEVILMTGTTMTGEQKREYIVDTMKRAGYSGATWVLRAGIEIAYGLFVVGSESRKS